MYLKFEHDGEANSGGVGPNRGAASAVADGSRLRSKASAFIQARLSPAKAAPVCRNGMRRMNCCVETPFVVWNENKRIHLIQSGSPVSGARAGRERR
jgi:hypothetical protein